MRVAAVCMFYREMDKGFLMMYLERICMYNITDFADLPNMLDIPDN